MNKETFHFNIFNIQVDGDDTNALHLIFHWIGIPVKLHGFVKHLAPTQGWWTWTTELRCEMLIDVAGHCRSEVQQKLWGKNELYDICMICVCTSKRLCSSAFSDWRFCSAACSSPSLDWETWRQFLRNRSTSSNRPGKNTEKYNPQIHQKQLV